MSARTGDPIKTVVLKSFMASTRIDSDQGVKPFGSRSGPTWYLGPNCLQTISADNKSLLKQGKS